MFLRSWPNSLRFLTITALVLAVFLFFEPSLSLAEESCNFQAEIESLNSLADKDLDYLESLKAELEIRRIILKKVTDCSLSEVRELKNQLNELKSDSIDNNSVRARILRDLDLLTNYYRVQQAGINDLDLGGSRALARRLLDWRVSDHRHTLDKASVFITWMKNQDLISSAERRLGQAGRLILAFKLTSVGEVMEPYSKANAALTEAKKANAEAKQAINSSFYPADEMSNMLKLTLESLSSVYQNLFEFNDVFKNLLPKL